MNCRFLACATLLASVIAPVSRPAHAQGISRVEAEAILAEAVTYVLGRNPPGRYTRPVLVVARVDADLARSAGIDTVALRESISRITGVPIWDGEKYCDTSGRWPHWRMTNADFRLSPALAAVVGDTAHVRVSLSGGSSIMGSTTRTLVVVRSGTGWAATGFMEGGMHALHVPCTALP